MWTLACQLVYAKVVQNPIYGIIFIQKIIKGISHDFNTFNWNFLYGVSVSECSHSG